MIRAIVLTSNKPRHVYYARTISTYFDLVGLVSEQKKGYYVRQKEESQLVQKHFELLQEKESVYFPETEFPDCDSLFLSKEEINSTELVAWAVEKKPDVVFLFGTSILKDRWLDEFPDRIINLHLGLSPFYRGSATMFWPYYQGKYECIGTTIHLAKHNVDAGEVLQQFKPELRLSESYYDLVTRAVKESIQFVPKIAIRYLSNEILPWSQDLHLGETYRKNDFAPEMLEEVFLHMSSGLTQKELENASRSKLCDCSQ